MLLRWAVLCCALAVVGCNEVHSARESGRIDRGQPAAGIEVKNFNETRAGRELATANEQTVAARYAAQELVNDAFSVERKIIYQADLRLVVTDFSNIEREVSRVVREHDGFLSNVAIDRTSGEQRTGTWQARIPTDRFDSFLEEVSKLGVPESRGQTAQDVTEEYIDLDARISNQKRLEERILQLLDKQQGEIKDVIAVEQELGRVRGEIERMEGRVRYLSNRVAMTTVSIYAREQRDYVPAQSPTFTSRIAEAWGSSLVSLRDFGANLAVASVGAAPWLVVVAVLAILPLRYVRRRMRSA